MRKTLLIPTLLGILVTSALVFSQVYVGTLVSTNDTVDNQPVVVDGGTSNLNVTPEQVNNNTHQVYVGTLLSIHVTVINQPAVVNGASLNLNVTPGQVINNTLYASMDVYQSGVYNFTINEELGQIFSGYNVTVYFYNSTSEMELFFNNGYPEAQQVYLSPGYYSVAINVMGVVSDYISQTSYSGPVISVYYFEP